MDRLVRISNQLGHLMTGLRPEQEFGCRPGEVTADGEVTIDFVECLASCGSGPVVLIDDDLHERVDAAKVKALSDQIKTAAQSRLAP